MKTRFRLTMVPCEWPVTPEETLLAHLGYGANTISYLPTLKAAVDEAAGTAAELNVRRVEIHVWERPKWWSLRRRWCWAHRFHRDDIKDPLAETVVLAGAILPAALAVNRGNTK